MNPIIVNVLGAPGAGKSVTRADVFCRLKRAGVNVEEVTEFAKDLVYEERAVTMRCQPYIFGKQLRNLERLSGKVDVIITDSPLILCSFYNKKYRAGAYSSFFDHMVIDEFRNMGPAVNVFLERVKPYQPEGRLQTIDESDRIGHELRALLDEEFITYTVKPGDEATSEWIADTVLAMLPDDKKRAPLVVEETPKRSLFSRIFRK